MTSGSKKLNGEKPAPSSPAFGRRSSSFLTGTTLLLCRCLFHVYIIHILGNSVNTEMVRGYRVRLSALASRLLQVRAPVQVLRRVHTLVI